jgi:hypothetical protein
MQKKMVELNSQSGISWDGVKYTAKFVTGGAFSLMEFTLQVEDMQLLQ